MLQDESVSDDEKISFIFKRMLEEVENESDSGVVKRVPAEANAEGRARDHH